MSFFTKINSKMSVGMAATILSGSYLSSAVLGLLRDRLLAAKFGIGSDALDSCGLFYSGPAVLLFSYRSTECDFYTCFCRSDEEQQQTICVGAIIKRYKLNGARYFCQQYHNLHFCQPANLLNSTWFWCGQTRSGDSNHAHNRH